MPKPFPKGMIPWNKGKKYHFKKHFVVCKACHKKFRVTPSRAKVAEYCSNKCQVYACIAGKFGDKNPSWKGGRWKISLGYVVVHSPNHLFKNADGYVYEHRLVVEKCIGRYLKPSEDVHHINGIRDDNRPENLMGFSGRSSHRRFEEGGIYTQEEIIFDGRTYEKEVALSNS